MAMWPFKALRCGTVVVLEIARNLTFDSSFCNVAGSITFNEIGIHQRHLLENFWRKFCKS